MGLVRHQGFSAYPGTEEVAENEVGYFPGEYGVECASISTSALKG
jgi:hypothetical protein